MGKVEIAFTSQMPGSQFINETPLAGELLHLPLDEVLGEDGNLLARDVSGAGRTATCSGATCPDPGQPGHVNSAMHFDGVDDRVGVAADTGLELSGGQFSEAAWINSEIADNGYHGIMGYHPLGKPVAERYPGMWVYQQTSITAGFGDGVNWNNFTVPAALHAGWNHVATTYDGAAYKLYVDGTLIYTDNSFSGRKPYMGTKQIEVGKVDIRYFKGAIDEARLYNRALTAEEVKAIYTGTGPLLVLPFDLGRATDGTRLADASAWDHDAVLSAGATDTANKAVPGQVGAGALKFDGVDDYVSASDSAGDLNGLEAFGDFAISEWFSLDALGAAGDGRDWASAASKGAWTGSDGWEVLVNRDSAHTNTHRIHLYFNGLAVASIPAPPGGWQTGKWYHYAFARSGSTLVGYLNGAKAVSVSSSTVPSANIGRTPHRKEPYRVSLGGEPRRPANLREGAAGRRGARALPGRLAGGHAHLGQQPTVRSLVGDRTHRPRRHVPGRLARHG